MLDRTLHPARRARTDRTAAWRSAGQAVVELAFIAPILLLILVGAIDAGRIFALTISVQNAAREGATFGAVKPTCQSAGTGTNQCPDPGNITYVARQELGGDSALAVTVTCATACASNTSATANTITVTVSRPFTFFTPLIGQILGSTINVRADATAAIQ